MAKLLLTTGGDSGHSFPMLQLARGLVQRGHQVCVHAPAELVDKISNVGAEPIPYARCRDVFIAARQPGWPRTWWLPPPLSKFRAAVVESAVEIAEELTGLVARTRPDVLLAEFASFGASYAAERTGVPFATFSSSAVFALTRDGALAFGPPGPAINAHLPAPVVRFLGRRVAPLQVARRRLGLPPRVDRTAPEIVQTAISPTLHLLPAHPGFYGGAPLAEGHLPIGPLASPTDQRTVEVPERFVLVTTTTTGKDNGLLRRVLDAVRELEVPVIATAASATDLPASLPGHVRVERFLPHDEVMPKAAAVVSHGGWGTTGKAMRYGVPTLVLALFGDQPIVGRQVARLGNGIALNGMRVTPREIGQALERLLRTQSFSERARQVADEIRPLDPIALASDALTRVARATQR